MELQAKEMDNLGIAKQLESENFESQRFLDGLAEDVEWFAAGPPEILPWAGTFKGRTAVKEWVKVLRSNLKYQKWESKWMVRDDVVIEFVHAKGVAQKTGRPYESEVIRIWTIRDGKAAKVRSYYDTAAYAMAVGTLQPTSEAEREED